MRGILHSSPTPPSQFILKSTSWGPSKPKRSWIQRACQARRGILDNFPTSSTTSYCLIDYFLTPIAKPPDSAEQFQELLMMSCSFLLPLICSHHTWHVNCFLPSTRAIHSRYFLKRWLPLLHYPAFWHLISMVRLIHSLWCVWFCIQPESYGNALLISTRVHKTIINSNSKIYSVASTSCLLYMSISFILITQRSGYYPAPGNRDTNELVGRRVEIQTQLGLHILVFCIFNEGRLFCFCLVSLQRMSFSCSVKAFWLPGYSASQIRLFLWKSQPIDLLQVFTAAIRKREKSCGLKRSSLSTSFRSHHCH